MGSNLTRRIPHYNELFLFMIKNQKGVSVVNLTKTTLQL